MLHSIEEDDVQNEIMDLTNSSESVKFPAEVQPTLPTKKKKNKGVSKLIDRLKMKSNGSHTHGFDIPKAILKKLKRKHIDSWQEDDLTDMDVDVEEHRIPPKRAKVVSQMQSNAAKKVDDANVRNSTTSESQVAAAAPGSDFKRSNLVNIKYSSKKTSRNEPVTKQNVTENDLSPNDFEQISHDDSDCLPWKAKSIFTALLYSYFTPQSQINSNPSESATLQNDTQAAAVKKHSLRYKCKICEQNGLGTSGTKSKRRVSGIVTCLYGNNSNMKRHIEQVSVLK